jgi:hypothetical protein
MATSSSGLASPSVRVLAESALKSRFSLSPRSRMPYGTLFFGIAHY